MLAHQNQEYQHQCALDHCESNKERNAQNIVRGNRKLWRDHCRHQIRLHSEKRCFEPTVQKTLEVTEQPLASFTQGENENFLKAPLKLAKHVVHQIEGFQQQCAHGHCEGYPFLKYPNSRGTSASLAIDPRLAVVPRVPTATEPLSSLDQTTRTQRGSVPPRAGTTDHPEQGRSGCAPTNICPSDKGSDQDQLDPQKLSTKTRNIAE